jgi:RNA polymerase-binding transcription factor DksA
MGREKNDQIAAEDRWKRKAENEMIRCEECGRTIEHDEREVYFSNRRCSTCQHAYEDFERE